ncbi:MAG: ClbS/DfsB family four-helix bundle protein [Thermoanaerobaculia bacterium]|nr:ClbS/DfsB family four-helix bundle protein [Thermoanaerobaculia bacterium]
MEDNVYQWLDNVLRTSEHEFSVLESQIPSRMHDAMGAVDDWSAKDVVAHLTYWLEVFSYNIDARTHSETLVDTENYKVLNREAWKLRNILTWDKVRLDLDRAFKSVQSRVHGLTATQLTDASCFSLQGQPLVADYMYELIEHPMHHWVILYRRASREDMALGMLERVQEGISQKRFMKWSMPARKKIRKHRQSLAP